MPSSTGGLLPIEIKQYITFYNTTGLIEQHKRIYFVPRFSKERVDTNDKISVAWLYAFNDRLTTNPNYSDIKISNWSPEDRTLKVKGNVDDFRAKQSYGYNLNYFILSRHVYSDALNPTVYEQFLTAFFITNVTQSGNGTIELTYEPDHFTNVFYLQNQHILTASDIANDYTPFNENMKNCYIKRQHYNRVKLVTGRQSKVEEVSGSDWIEVAQDKWVAELTFTFESLMGYTFSEIALEVKITGGINSSYYISDWDSRTGTLEIHIVNEDRLEAVYDVTITVNEPHLEPDNLERFLNTEETFKFKYQYRDSKKPFSILPQEDYSNFTEEELTLIDDVIDGEGTPYQKFKFLPELLRMKIIKNSLSFVVITTSDYLTKPTKWITQPTSAPDGFTKVTTGAIKNNTRIFESFQKIVVPITNYNEKFVYFKTAIQNLIYFYTDDEKYSYKEFDCIRPEKLTELLSGNSWADYIVSAVVVKDIPVITNRMILQDSTITSTYTIKLYVEQPQPHGEGLGTEANPEIFHLNDIYLNSKTCINVLKDSPTDTAYYDAYYNSTTQQYTYDYIGVNKGSVIILAGGIKEQFNLKISDVVKNPQHNYFDNILETEPYSFYSISYLGNYESLLTKNRYYQSGYYRDGYFNYNVKIIYNVSFNEAVKMSLLPIYAVNNTETIYYSEGLTFTTSAQLPLHSDSYFSYYNQNKAQMKNQFAVNNLNQGMGLLKTGISAPTQIISGIANPLGAGFGAGLKAGQVGTDLVNGAVDWASSNARIDMTQKSVLADVGTRPDTVKQTGSDVYYDLQMDEFSFYLNHYKIDELSYNSIARILERLGYTVNLYDNINATTRVGWDYVQIISFDYEANITVLQEEAVRNIFSQGVTLLHEPSYFTNGHNFETILEE